MTPATRPPQCIGILMRHDDTLIRRHPFVLALTLAACLSAACTPDADGNNGPGSQADTGGGSDVGSVGSSDGGPTGDARASDAGQDARIEEPADPDDQGGGCAAGCNLNTCVLDSDQCDGVCIWDGNLGAAYCSRRCVATCPGGYTCVQTEDESGPACLSNTPECGNATVEFGEACDDGNTEDGDLCAGNCKQVTTPPSGGRVVETIGDRDSVESMGEDPVVFARRIGDRLFLGTSGSSIDYAFNLPDDAGPAPFNALLEAGLVEGSCQLGGSTFVSITRFDPVAKEVAGSASANMSCLFGCEFGCVSELAYSIGFDVNWVDE
jgi:cysteine-rich repeat protein